MQDTWTLVAIAMSPVFVTAFIALLAWLFKTKLDSIEVASTSNARKLDTLDSRLDGIDVQMASRASADAVDQTYRELRQNENDRRLNRIETTVDSLAGEIKRDMGIVHGRLDAVLGREAGHA